MVLQLLDDPASEWWGGRARDAVLKTSFAQAVDALSEQLGTTPGDGRWGRLHTASFTPRIGKVQLLDRLFNAGPIIVPSENFTLSNTSFWIGRSFGGTMISSMRMILDLSDLDRSPQILPPGQSGQSLSKHYGDMLLPWCDAQYAPMHFDRTALDQVCESVLVLLP